VDARDVFDTSFSDKLLRKMTWEPRFKLADEPGMSPIEEVLLFLSKNGYELRAWLDMNAGNVHGLDMLNSLLIHLQAAVQGKDGRTEGMDTLKELTSKNSIVVIFYVLFEVLVRQAQTVGPARLLRTKNMLLGFFDVFNKMNGVYPGVAILLRGLEVAHDMAKREEVTINQWQLLWGSAKELLELYPESDFENRVRFAPVLRWSDLVFAQLSCVANSQEGLSDSVAGKEAVEKGLWGCWRMVEGVGRVLA
jgi:hypothetical protein